MCGHPPLLALATALHYFAVVGGGGGEVALPWPFLIPQPHPGEALPRAGPGIVLPQMAHPTNIVGNRSQSLTRGGM